MHNAQDATKIRLLNLAFLSCAAAHVKFFFSTSASKRLSAGWGSYTIGKLLSSTVASSISSFLARRHCHGQPFLLLAAKVGDAERAGSRGPRRYPGHIGPCDRRCGGGRLSQVYVARAGHSRCNTRVTENLPIIRKSLAYVHGIKLRFVDEQ